MSHAMARALAVTALAACVALGLVSLLVPARSAAGATEAPPPPSSEATSTTTTELDAGTPTTTATPDVAQQYVYSEDTKAQDATKRGVQRYMDSGSTNADQCAPAQPPSVTPTTSPASDVTHREVQRYMDSGNANANQCDPALAPLVTPPATDDPGVVGRATCGVGLFDIGGHICRAINDWFRGLVADALNPLLDLVGRTVFATPDVSAPGRARDIWLVSMGIANAIFVLIVLVGGIVLMGNETVQTSYTLKELLPRIVVGWVGANLSLWIVGELIRFANAASQTFLGSATTDRATAMRGLKTLTLEPFGRNGGLPVTLLLLVVVVLAVGIVATYVVRVANLVVLTVAGPILIAAYALPRGEGAARMWWRALCGCLLVQVGQALMLAVAMRVLFDSDGQRALGIPGGPLMDVTIVGCLFWGMLQLPTYAGRLVFAPRPTSVARTYLVSRGVRRAIGTGR